MTVFPKKIISGGQRGADRAGLDAGRALGLPTGGTAPKGWKVRLPSGEDVSDPELAGFGLVESKSPSYAARTRTNVSAGDGTVWFGYELAPGGKVTIGHCRKLGKPCLINPTAEELAAWVVEHRIATLNVAGNRESSFNPDIYQTTYQTLMVAFTRSD